MGLIWRYVRAKALLAALVVVAALFTALFGAIGRFVGVDLSGSALPFVLGAVLSLVSLFGLFAGLAYVRTAREG